jgi:radical SAM-linked protein
MTFAAPLSIGTESVCEFLDVTLTESPSPEEMMKALNANMTDEMQVIEAYYPETKFTDLKWLSYTMLVYTNGADAALAEKCNAALSDEKLEILKNTKSGEAIVDIRPLVRSADVVFDADHLRISCTLSADPSSFLNPEYVIKLLRERCGILADDNLLNESYSIMRERAFDVDMQEFK